MKRVLGKSTAAGEGKPSIEVGSGAQSVESLNISSSMLAVDTPAMPSPEDLEKRFRIAAEQMNLPAEMLGTFTDEKKWKLVCDMDAKKEDSGEKPIFYVQKIDKLLSKTKHHKRLHSYDLLHSKKDHRISRSAKEDTSMKELSISLRTNSMKWVKEFIDPPNSGVMKVIDYCKQMEPERRREDEHYLILCLKAIMNNSYGFSYIMTDAKTALHVVAMGMLNDRQATQVASLELLSAVSLVPGGHECVSDALSFQRNALGDEYRHKTFISRIKDEKLNFEFLIAAFTFINVFVHSVPDLNMRVFYQGEFDRYRIMDVAEECLSLEVKKLSEQVEAFKDNYVDIAAILAADDKYEGPDASSFDNGRGGSFSNLLMTKDDSLENENKILKANEARSISKISEMQLQLNELKESQRQLEQTNNKLKEMSASAANNVPPPTPPKTAVTEPTPAPSKEPSETPAPTVVETICSKCKGDAAPTLAPVTGGPPPPPPPGGAAPPPPPPPGAGPPPPPPAPGAGPPPPPPPPGGGPPPPPPPPGAPGAGPPPPPGAPGIKTGPPPKRKIQTGVPLPTLNWQPIKNVDGTIFADVDDEKVLKKLDFKSFESKFGTASKAKQAPAASSAPKRATMSGVAGGPKEKKITVLDGNRSRTCNILMKKMPLKIPALKTALEKYDLEVITEDICEVLVKLLPQQEEIDALAEYKANLGILEEGDKFMCETLSIPRYASKIKIISFMHNFDTMIEDVKPGIDAILAACGSLKESKKFENFIEVVLAFGNYMNSAKRGGQYGFKMSTLNKLRDVKSGSDRSLTLLHFIEEVMRTQYPKDADFYNELLFLDKAASVSMATVNSDAQSLKQSLVILEGELKASDSKPLKEFSAKATSTITTITSNVQKMQTLFQETTKYFGETNKNIEPEEFFGVLSRFIADYQKAKIENNERVAREKRQAASAANKANNKKLNVTAETETKKDIRKSFVPAEGAIDNLISELNSKPLVAHRFKPRAKPT